MHLDDLVQQISAASRDPGARGLCDLFRDWKSDQRTVEELRESVERYIGNGWIQSTAEHEVVYALWAGFRDQAILAIAGMTMNERLSWFSLSAQFDACQSDHERSRLYDKLLAKP